MLDNTEDILEKFARRVIQQSRTRLTKGNNNVDKKLYDSLKYDLKVYPSAFILQFFMEDYGAFVDEGVKGTQSSAKAPNSKFRYKQSSNLVGLEAATGVFGKWAKKRGFRLRDTKGKFAKGTYKRMGFILAQSIKKKGIKATHFFSRSFEQTYKKLPDELIQAYRLDLQEFLKTTTSGN